ncbi:acyltransferase [Alcanivorax sp. S6407]|uniref:acyltransferase family protein n=1 Tax=Alcanivorax sp. S6407 TaxID=2926424 RepID=UPI001FF40DF1|nr:acyltransferase family protein [Alcanivorax sp. S6407]MCK0152831.1 acyltransferase [Alcanivorax sp. S6407]
MAIAYRPEIDGLRFLAVALVILHHLGIPGFNGGFVGVDVFFVISGYLITSILVKEVSSSAFSFGGFYRRRVIRLAPAYFLVLLASGVLACFTLLPAELVQFAKSTIYSTFFAANFFMWDAVGGYFGSGADTTPLLHLWSLAVEEQFYLFWPVGFLVLVRLFPSRLSISAVIVLMLIATVMVSQYGALNYPAAAYYLMPTRAFELLIGAALVFLPSFTLGGYSRYVRMVLSAMGLGLIAYSSIFFDKSIWFPGLNALIPCIGTALIILFAREGLPIVGPLLTNRFSVAIGKISYPAYLWHWPIIAFLNIHLIEITPSIAMAVISAALVLSWLTYQFLELPARHFRSRSSSCVIMAGFVLPAAVFTLIAYVIIAKGGLPVRFSEDLNRRAAAVMSHADAERGRCNEGPVSAPLPEYDCVLGVRKSDVDILLVGDSHANHFSGMIDVLAREAGLRGYDVTQSNSVFLMNTDRYYKQGNELVHHASFRKRNDYIATELLPRGYHYVVLGASYAGHINGGLFTLGEDERGMADDSLFHDSLRETIKAVVSYGSVPVLIKGNPTFESDISRCTLNNHRFGLDADCNLVRSEFDSRFSAWNKMVDSLEAEFDTLMVIDPSRVICDDDYCYSEIDGLPLYKDGNHLNYMGSEFVGEQYLKHFGNPFRNEMAAPD